MFGGAPPGGARGKVLLRVLCHAYGSKIVLLLNGLVGFKEAQARDRKALRRGPG